jgi:integrase
MGRVVTVHGFRSSFRDWAAEITAYPNHVVEMALTHTSRAGWKRLIDEATCSRSAGP